MFKIIGCSFGVFVIIWTWSECTAGSDWTGRSGGPYRNGRSIGFNHRDLRFTIRDISEIVRATHLGNVSGGKHDIYSGYSVHKVTARSAEDRELLAKLQTTFDLDDWEQGVPGERDFMFMVSPANVRKFLEELDTNGLKHVVHRADVAKSFEEFDEELAAWRSSRSNREAVPFDDYPRYAEVDAYMERIAADYPDLVTLVNAGLSFENRPIKYLKISTTNFTDTSKPIYFMDAMIHAREWVTTPVALYSIHRLVVDLREEDRDLLDNMDWIILPIVNPDGYEFTHTNTRLWRKTRSFNESVSACYGIDANRNFDVAFNTVGVSSNPCQDTYPGLEPFSEPETQIVRDIMFEHLDRIAIYMNIHSHGNWILYGYGDTTIPENGLQLFHVGAAMGATIDALKLDEASYYRVGNSAILLYPSSGSAQDYGQHVGIPLSYTLELPGYGVAFQVPPRYIAQINMETWAGLAVSARMARLYHMTRG